MNQSDAAADAKIPKFVWGRLKPVLVHDHDCLQTIHFHSPILFCCYCYV